MMTRGQVAKRLGVSIAAVRKFEGSELHPEMRDGRWLFDVNEVERLVRLRTNGGGRLTTPFDDHFREFRGEPRQGSKRNGFEPRPTGDRKPNRETSRSLKRELSRLQGNSVRQTDALTTVNIKSAMPQDVVGIDTGLLNDTEKSTRGEARQLLVAVDDFLSEMEALSPRQLRRYLRLNGDTGELLEWLVQSVDEEILR